MFIAVDIGGTNIRVAGSASLEKPTLLGRVARRNNNADYDADIAFIVESARHIGGSNIQAVGVGIVGSLNDQGTELRSAHNRPHWNSKPFVADIQARLDCDVIADNDGVAAALAEAYYDVKQSNFAYVIWGTGIGGAIVTTNDGEPIVKQLDWAVHFKEWENRCGGRMLATLYGKPTENLSDEEWREVIRVFTQEAQDFIAKTHTRSLVFGGGLSVRHRKELEKLADALRIPVAITRFSEDGGLYGGLALIKRRLSGRAKSLSEV